jgi:glycosyltransferase involved in cell wall biosynthesis
MKVSIVTLSFNQAEFLECAIRSVLDQSGADIEYIVVDAGSTDGSREIINRYRGHISHLILEPDNGPADGLNKAFKQATGELFGYINSDDFYLNGGVEKAVCAARQCNSRVGAIVGNGVTVDADEVVYKRVFSTRFTPYRYVQGASLSLQQSSFYYREAFMAVGGFNICNTTCWDGEILLDIALMGYDICHFNADIGAFRLHTGSITGSGRLRNAYQKDRERMFYKAVGRRRNRFDRLIIEPTLKTLSYIENPRALALKLTDKARVAWSPQDFRGSDT